MKKIFSILLMGDFLSGCATTSIQREQEVVIQYERIVVVPPATFFELPPEVNKLDLDKKDLKQSDVAIWITEMNERMKKLENKIQEIGKFLQDAQKN